MTRARLFGVTVVGLCFLISCGKVDEKTARKREALKDLTSTEASVRVDAIGRAAAMAATAEDANEYVPHIVAALGDKEAQVRSAAVGALSGLGEKAAPSLKKLQKLAAEDASAEVRSAALSALEQLAPGADATLGLYKSALDDKDLTVAHAAASALMAYPDKASSSIGSIAKVVQRSIKQAVSSGEPPREGLALALTLAEAGEGAKDAIPVFQSIAGDAEIPAPVGQALKVAIGVINGEAKVEDLARAIDIAGGGPPRP